MRSLPLLLIALVAIACDAHAGWSVDPGPSGLLVPGMVYPLHPVVSDGAGGALVGYEGYCGNTNSVGHIHLQKLDSQGSLAWLATVGDVGGIGGYYGPVLCPDAAGGAVAVWSGPAVNPPLANLFAQRISSTGSRSWNGGASGEGVHLTDDPHSYKEPKWVAQDGTGGFITTWVDARNDPYAVMAQRIDGAGNVQWGPTGIDLGFDIISSPSFVSDGSGGFLAFWSAPGPSGDRDLFAQHFGRDGAPRWSPGGIPICSQPGDQGRSLASCWQYISCYPSIAAVADNAGGAIVAWIDSRADFYGDVFAQRVDPTGALLWAPQGVPLCTATGAESTVVAVQDGAGGLIAVWQDARINSFTQLDLYAQRIGGDGVVRWMSDGVPLSTAAGDQTLYIVDQPSSCITADGAGGFFAAWKSPGGVATAQHLDASGARLWPTQGLQISGTGAGNVSVVPDGSTTCTLLWGVDLCELRARSSSGAVTGIGRTESVAFQVQGVRPNPARGQFMVDFSLVEPGAVRLDVFDIAGRLVARQDSGQLDPGSHAFVMRELPPGVYTVQLRQAGRSAVAHVIALR